MATPPNFIDLARQQRLAANNRLSCISVVNGGAPASQNVAIPVLPPVPDYQKNGWNLSYSVTVSSPAFALDTKTLIAFDPSGTLGYATYQNLPFTGLLLNSNGGKIQWNFNSVGTTFYYLSTVDGSIYKSTPIKTATQTVPVSSYAVWVSTDAINWPVSALYVQPVY
jgi:hypothetical protein